MLRFTHKSRALLLRRFNVSTNSFVEMVAWPVPVPLKGSLHDYKYRFAYVVEEACVLRYDNEAGKGDHRHLKGKELPYVFVSYEQLVRDFLNDVEAYPS